MESKDLIQYFAQFVNVTYTVITNVASPGRFQARIILTNNGVSTIHGQKWQIYFNHMTMIEKKQQKESGKAILGDGIAQIRHVQGSLFCLEPLLEFGDLEPGQARVLDFTAAHSCVSRYTIFPNWYVVLPGEQPRTIACTKGESLDFVTAFDTPEKWRRSSKDLLHPMSPEERFDRYMVNDLNKPGKVIVPTPNYIETGDGSVKIDASWKIIASEELGSQSILLKEALKLQIVKTTTDSQKNCIKLCLKPIKEAEDIQVKEKLHKDTLKEAYILHIDAIQNSIEIKAQTSTGIFYGVQSLLSLLDGGSKEKKLEALRIVDIPRYPYRGLHLDVARNFHDTEQVIQLLRVMSLYKLNKFHFHLTDDEGWRLEIPGIPELTELAALRGHDLNETECLLPQYGSGPEKQGLGCGYYTTKQYQKILDVAASLHIEVIPEIDMPGHSRAAIKAIEKWKASHKNQSVQDFSLCDPEDISKYKSVQMYNDNVINPCLESTYQFIEHIVETLVNLHHSHNPLKFFHFGGDEVPKGSVTQSPAKDKFLTTHPDVTNIFQYFVERVAKIGNKFGLGIAGWEDAYFDHMDQIINPKSLHNGNLLAYSWWTVWGKDSADRSQKLANEGYQVILAPCTHFYLDHAYEADPEERGLYYANHSNDTKRVFSYNPTKFYWNFTHDIWGRPADTKSINESAVKIEKPENIIGIQCQLWSETVRTNEHLQYMLFPRVLAFAERAWHRADWEDEEDQDVRKRKLEEDWKDFANSLGYKELQRLESMGINYRVAPPGAKSIGGKLQTNTEFPSMDVERTSQPVANRTNLHTVSSKRRSRSILLVGSKIQEPKL